MNKISYNTRLIGYLIKPLKSDSDILIELACDDIDFKADLDNNLFPATIYYRTTFSKLNSLFQNIYNDALDLYENTSKYYFTFKPTINYNEQYYYKEAIEINKVLGLKKKYYHNRFLIPFSIDDKIIYTSYELKEKDFIFFDEFCYFVETTKLDETHYKINKATMLSFERFMYDSDYFIDGSFLYFINRSFVKINKINELDLSNYSFNEIINQTDKEESKIVKETIESAEIKEEIKEENKDDKELSFRFLYDELELNSYNQMSQAFYELVNNERKELYKYLDKDVSEVKDLILEHFYKYLIFKKLIFNYDDVVNFVCSIMSNQLTILAGQSGIGKSKLPLTFSEYFNVKAQSHLLFVPISPSYTEPQDILGFYNPQTNKYVPSETKLAEFLVDAERNPDKLYIVIFDEMNLSQIEYYFSSFISLLENNEEDRKLNLYSDKLTCVNNNEFPSTILIRKNIRFIGTINIDETTKTISDRLIDRSLIINLSKVKFSMLREYSSNIGEYNILLPTFDPYLLLSSDIDFVTYFNDNHLNFFDDLNEVLIKTNARFAISYRNLRIIANYLNYAASFASYNKSLALDFVISETILRKIRGSFELNNLLEHDLITVFKKYNYLSDFKISTCTINKKIEEIAQDGFAK